MGEGRSSPSTSDGLAFSSPWFKVKHDHLSLVRGQTPTQANENEFGFHIRLCPHPHNCSYTRTTSEWLYREPDTVSLQHYLLPPFLGLVLYTGPSGGSSATQGDAEETLFQADSLSLSQRAA